MVELGKAILLPDGPQAGKCIIRATVLRVWGFDALQIQMKSFKEFKKQNNGRCFSKTEFPVCFGGKCLESTR